MNRNNLTAFLSIAGARLTMVFVSAAITPLLVRLLTPSQYGTYAFLMAVFGLVMILTSSGINSGVRKYLAEERDRADWKNNVFGYYFRLAALLAAVPALLFVILAQVGVLFGDGAWQLPPVYTKYLYLLAILALAAQFREYVRRALMGLKLEHLSEPLRVLYKVAFGVFAVGLAALGYGVYGVITGTIIASILVFLVAFAILSREISPSSVLSRPPPEFPSRELFTFNHMSIVYFFLLTSMYHVDVIMLTLFRGQSVTGTYKGALAIVGFLWLAPKAVQSVMLQSTSTLWAEGKVAEVQELATKVTRYTLLLTTLLVVGLAALASKFVPLYLSEKHAAAVLPVLVLLPGTLGFAVARPVLSISLARGALKVIIAATGAAALLNLALNAALIPMYGMGGAALATTVGYASLPLFHAWGARHIGYRPFSGLRPVRVAATAVLAGVPIVGLAALFDSAVPALIVVPPVGFVLFSAFALLTGAITIEEVLEVFAALPAPVGPRAEELHSQVSSSDSGTPFSIRRVGQFFSRG